MNGVTCVEGVAARQPRQLFQLFKVALAHQTPEQKTTTTIQEKIKGGGEGRGEPSSTEENHKVRNENRNKTSKGKKARGWGGASHTKRSFDAGARTEAEGGGGGRKRGHGKKRKTTPRGSPCQECNVFRWGAVEWNTRLQHGDARTACLLHALPRRLITIAAAG